MLPDLMFYVLSSILVLGAAGVVLSRNPMYSVLLLILCFLNAAGLFILLGAEFLGLLLVMVYVGAIAVMFLFVLMTIDIDFAMLREGFASYMPVGVLVGVILVVELIMAITSGVFTGHAHLASVAVMPVAQDQQNIVNLGSVLFTDYLLPFQMAALVLLVAMVGAIVLTHRKRPGVKRQNITAQIARRREDSVELKKVKPGQGIL